MSASPVQSAAEAAADEGEDWAADSAVFADEDSDSDSDEGVDEADEDAAADADDSESFVETGAEKDGKAKKKKQALPYQVPCYITLRKGICLFDGQKVIVPDAGPAVRRAMLLPSPLCTVL